MTVVDDILGAPAAPAPRFATPQIGTVRRVTGQGLMVTLDLLGDTRLVGPCPWARPIPATPAGYTTHDHGITHDTPPAGTRCLVAFAGGQLDGAWVIAFDRWPA